MTDGAFRTCPHCGLRNRHYMLVCTRCTRSLRNVPLVGTPPPGAAVPVSSRSGRRVTVFALALMAALVGAVILSRVLRSSPLEQDAAASSRAHGEPPSATDTPDPGGWETLDERFAALPPPAPSPPAAAPSPPPAGASPPPVGASLPAASPPAATPSAPASAPAATAVPSLPMRAPVALTPATPEPEPAASATEEPSSEAEPVERPAPVRPRPTPRAEPPAEATETGVRRREVAPPTPDDDPVRVRAERRAALRRAEERLQALERRAADLRRRADDESADVEDREQQQRELAKVLRQWEEAERQVVRAEWALRDVEQ